MNLDNSNHRNLVQEIRVAILNSVIILTCIGLVAIFVSFLLTL